MRGSINFNNINFTTKNILPYLMSEEASKDIDSQIDFWDCEFLIEKGIIEKNSSLIIAYSHEE